MRNTRTLRIAVTQRMRGIPSSSTPSPGKTRLTLALTAVLLAAACAPDSVEEPPRHVGAHDAWQPLPTGTITRVAFGSCTRRLSDQSIWNTVVAADPDLFLHLGDAIYPDVNDEETAVIDPWPNPDTLARIEAF